MDIVIENWLNLFFFVYSMKMSNLIRENCLQSRSNYCRIFIWSCKCTVHCHKFFLTLLLTYATDKFHWHQTHHYWLSKKYSLKYAWKTTQNFFAILLATIFSEIFYSRHFHEVTKQDSFQPKCIKFVGQWKNWMLIKLFSNQNLW